MAETTRMTFKETVMLIEAKQEFEGGAKFKAAEGNTKRYSQLWKDIAGNLNNQFDTQKFSYNNVRNKYNQLFSKYKTERQTINKSGAGVSTWVYWDVFGRTVPQSTRYQLINVMELGFGKENILNRKEPDNDVINESNKCDADINPKKGKTYREIKIEALESLININKQKIDVEMASKKDNKKYKKLKMEIETMKGI